MRIALAQQAPVPGDVVANAAAHAATLDEARAAGARLVVFPELSLSGYALAGDGLEAAALPADAPVLTRLAAAAGAMDALVGFPERAPGGPYNSAAYLSGGRVAHVQRKTHLPTYSRWDEGRRFGAGDGLRAFPAAGGPATVLICHDAWHAVLPFLAALDGARLLLVPACSGTPGDIEALAHDWGVLLNHHARFAQVHVVFANRVGDEGGAHFWGGSRVLDPFGAVLVQGPRDAPALVLADLDPAAVERRRAEIPLLAHARLDLLAQEFSRLGRDRPGR